MGAIIVCGFPGVGKSYLFKHQEEFGIKVLDSDSSAFSWIVERRPNGNKTRNPDFPQNYIDHINDNIDKCDVILVSSHKEVRKALETYGIKYWIVYPAHEEKDNYIKRFLERGNDSSFVQLLYNNWKDWIDDIEHDVRSHEDKKYFISSVILRDNTNLSDVINIIINKSRKV